MLITQPFVKHSNIQYGSPFGKKVYCIIFTAFSFNPSSEVQYVFSIQPILFHFPMTASSFTNCIPFAIFIISLPSSDFSFYFKNIIPYLCEFFYRKSPKSLYRQRHLGTISSIRTFPVQAIKFSPGFSAGTPSPVTVSFLRTVLLKQFISSLLHLNLKTIF